MADRFNTNMDILELVSPCWRLLMSQGQEKSLGTQAFQEKISAETPLQNTRLSRLVNRFGQRFATSLDVTTVKESFGFFPTRPKTHFACPVEKSQFTGEFCRSAMTKRVFWPC
jgi:hypothetical protein